MGSLRKERRVINVQMYTVRPPIGGRKTLMSGRVMNSGYIPPVSSNKERRSKDSVLCATGRFTSVETLTPKTTITQIPHLSATPGRHQTGSKHSCHTGDSLHG